jgi:hypothetical protein
MLGGINYNIPYNIQPGPTPVNNLRLWPFYNGVNRQLAYGSLSYNGLIAKLEKRFSRGLTFLASYTWSHAIDNLDEVGNGEGTGATYFWDRNQNRGPSLTDIRHAFIFSSTYELPFGKAKMFLSGANKLVDAVLGGWQLSGVFSKVTGEPLTVTTSGGLTNAGGADRPNRIRDGALPASERTIDRWFDVGAFTVQPQYTYGNSGRNILNGPGTTNLDFSLAKYFNITERFRLQFRAEAFNASNTPAFGNPNANITGAGVGQITSAGEPRRVQFGLKLLY